MIVQRLKEQIEAINTQIKEIQSECSHPKLAVHKIPRRTDEEFYNDCHCQLCDKRWTEDQ